MSEKTIPLTTLYLNQLSEKEKKAYEIATSHLGCSFHLEKSDGFLNFVKKWNSTNANPNRITNPSCS